MEMRHKQLVDCTATKKHVLAHDTAAVVAGEALCEGDALAEGQGICGGEAALGKNLVVAYMPWRGGRIDVNALLDLIYLYSLYSHVLRCLKILSLMTSISIASK